MRKIFSLVLLLLCATVGFTGCSKEEVGSPSGGKGKGSVKITSVSIGRKTNGRYSIKVGVKASGVTAGEVKDIGITWGSTSGANKYRSGTRGATSTTRSISYSANSVFYAKPFLTTSSGEVKGTVERIRVPK